MASNMVSVLRLTILPTFRHCYVLVLLISTILIQNAESKFLCKGRGMGYYADVESGCQMYHMCDGHGRQFSYHCPNATLFQQRMLICDHWYMVNCSKSEDEYKANLVIGHKEKLFVEDSYPYHRTPRPDLQPTAAEYNIIFRRGRQEVDSKENLVSAASSATRAPFSSNNNGFKFGNGQLLSFNANKNTQNEKVKKVPLKFKKVAVTESPIAFKSRYRATTPVFSAFVEQTTLAPHSVGLLPPLEDSESNFKVTTTHPPFLVNFRSNYSATTPNYPLSVESTSIDPGELGVLAPIRSNSTQKKLNENANRRTLHVNLQEERNRRISQKIIDTSLVLDLLPPLIDPKYRVSGQSKVLIQPPSKFYQPPIYEPKYNTQNTVKRKSFSSPSEWEVLRKKFLIPDYEFPLDTAERPNYKEDA